LQFVLQLPDQLVHLGRLGGDLQRRQVLVDEDVLDQVVEDLLAGDVPLGRRELPQGAVDGDLRDLLAVDRGGDAGRPLLDGGRGRGRQVDGRRRGVLGRRRRGGGRRGGGRRGLGGGGTGDGRAGAQRGGA